MSINTAATASPAAASTVRAGARRSTQILLALGATLAGCFAASAALGLALPRADGARTGTLLTGLGLVSAGVLLVVAAWLLVRATGGWWRLVLLPWLVLVLVAVYALSIALAAVYSPRPPAGRIPPGAVPVSMMSADGVPLAGWYLSSRNGASVVLRHGAGSRASDTEAQALALHEAGFGVLATDARGHGASGGQSMDLGWHGEADIDAAVEFLSGRDDVDDARIAVVGLSMGGEEAIGAAGVDDRICAVVAEGATGRTAGDKSWLAQEYGVAGVVQGWLDAVTYGLIDLLAQTRRPPTLAESIQAAEGIPFLLIAAGEVPDEALVAERLQQIDPNRVAIWVADGAQHTAAIRSSPQEWSSRVVGFLETAFVACGG
jgi:pimeloyl-ACP methyl ester carboxylesterase